MTRTLVTAGLLAALLAAGCNNSSPTAKTSASTPVNLKEGGRPGGKADMKPPYTDDKP